MTTQQLVFHTLAGAALLAALTGCRNYMSFSTATKFGLDISQRADQQPEVTVGYQRAEIASIPVREHRERMGPGKRRTAATRTDTNATFYGDANATNDAYAVLGVFAVQYDPNILTGGVHIRQVFATGFAARCAATNEGLASAIGTNAKQVINTAIKK